MASSSEPLGAPPPYTETTPDPNHLSVPKARNGIPPISRRSMEDEGRPLPPNWIRQYDHQTHHQFFVDTSAEPPRSIWQHPYDDEHYLASISDSERARIKNMHRVPSRADLEAESSADDERHDEARMHESQGEEVTGIHKLGRKMKDKLTGSTHTEREARRREREEEERRMYEQHQHIRQAMSRAAQTGEPQLLGKDRNGKEVYIEPPPPMTDYGGMGFGGPRAYPGNAYGYNPYQSGVYGNPNARFARPQMPYARPMGFGYGGGYGMGMGAPLLGLGGGLMLGNMMF